MPLSLTRLSFQRSLSQNELAAAMNVFLQLGAIYGVLSRNLSTTGSGCVTLGFLLLVQKNISVREVPLNKHSLDSSDVFILDLGLELYQWNGKTANKDERLKAAQYVQQLKVGMNGSKEGEGERERGRGGERE